MDPHIAELERRLDSGQTWDQQKKTLPKGVPQIGRIDPGGAVNHPHQKGKPPVSVSLPRAAGGGQIVNRNGHNCREIKPGLYTDMQGRRIIDSKSARDRHAADCGFVDCKDD